MTFFRLRARDQGLVDRLFSEKVLASYGLDDVVVGGKAQMVHSDKQFILIKLPLNMELPNFAVADKGDGESQVKPKAQQQKDYEREVVV